MAGKGGRHKNMSDDGKARHREGTDRGRETQQEARKAADKQAIIDTTGRNPDKPVPGSQAYAEKHGWTGKKS